MSVSAERWAIQVFAYSSEVRAAAITERLREVGFDAYLSTPPDSSLVQVRIGCFSAQADAEALAQDVRRRVALDALVVPFQEGDAATVCVIHQLGFIPPAMWGIATAADTSVTFWLEADGRRTITFDGSSWQIAQEATAPPPRADSSPDLLESLLETNPPPGLSAGFRATRSRGLPLVRADLGGGSLLIAAGKLLWHSDRVAVVQEGTQEGSDVFALRLYRP